MAADDGALLDLVDRIYESVDRPELWPVTIRAIGEVLGGRRHFWDLDRHSERLAHNFALIPSAIGACEPMFLLSRAGLRFLDEYDREFGELIIRFLKVVFLSILWSPNDVHAREAIGLVLTQRYVAAFDALSSPGPTPAGAARRTLIAALWADGHAFGTDSLRAMQLLMPHLDRAVRLQVRLSIADVQADRVAGALDVLTVGVILVARSGKPLWANRRAQEIMRDANGVRLRAAGLMGRRPADTRSLHELIQGAVSGGSQGLAAISRGEDSRPLLAIAVPLKPPAEVTLSIDQRPASSSSAIRIAPTSRRSSLCSEPSI
ncbi:MAG TPA: hypothetical protein VKX28_00905 [Xanthobacteraceae bacterium]|nr:hypothetical protein [Xanthobacteraceae bacterium]